MTNKISTTKQGFTIIEVVLVLAIAGLIFLMVFVAFPALQRNQRDTQRRQDYADLGAAVITSSANNNSHSLPGDGNSTILANAIGNDPQTGTAYTVTVQSEAPSGLPDLGTIIVYKTGTCGEDGATPSSGGSANNFVIYGRLENGSYCKQFSI